VKSCFALIGVICVGFVVIFGVMFANNFEKEKTRLEAQNEAARMHNAEVAAEEAKRGGKPPKKGTPPKPVAEVADESGGRFTQAKFDRLNDGISYESAVKILGAPGKLASSVKAGDIKIVMYTWQNEDGSNLNAQFQNNKLVTKAQFGLQ